MSQINEQNSKARSGARILANQDFEAVAYSACRKEEPVDPTKRPLIDQLISSTGLYNNSHSVQQLLDFTVRMRAFSPFNALLLHIQKPNLTHAATAEDWWMEFGRIPRSGAQPALIVRVLGPVDFVFDISETNGHAVPDQAFAFSPLGVLDDWRFRELLTAIKRDKFELVELEDADPQDGWIKLAVESPFPRGKNQYQLAYKPNLPAQVRFVNLAIEIGRLFLGHLGPDSGRIVKDRRETPQRLREVEAELVTFLVARRNGINLQTENFNRNHVGAFRQLDLYTIMRAANSVETVLGISAQKLWKERQVEMSRNKEVRLKRGMLRSLDAYARDDYAAAMHGFRICAGQGASFAQYGLGFMYACGIGVPRDLAEAAKWFQLSARQGNKLARRGLGIIDSNARGVANEDTLESMQLHLAEEQGVQE